MTQQLVQDIIVNYQTTQNSTTKSTGTSVPELKAWFTREHNRSVPSTFHFLERTNSLFTRERNIAYQFCIVFRQEFNRSVDIFSICLFRPERNDRNGMVLFEVFPSERNPSASHFLEQYGTKWNDLRSRVQGV